MEKIEKFKQSRKKRHTSYKLQAHLVDELESIAKAEGMSRNALVELALLDFVERYRKEKQTV
ncbi:hypothetical protein JCM14244_16850 [Venenivibrio stagnispumantis]|uniref:Ribbon-helix-helix protein, copG family n=1 Tax=Venenivibrio stagnispumantis TaxID=407998 RepID=A0AA46AG22_9AQUI|nr:ribbon-helix-helix protein, CopG family [Venenivibrio stagnispumantis]MCW4574021.1 ribbon-helix-helix protein, CopG family [Venenivibrio stagnispumantis]SMP23427.1 Ribbon-helix-helix protein, copG family [Venenivibrio stagnispumantis]